MPPVDIPFPVTSGPGKVPHDSAGRLINCYAEDLVAGARSRTVWRRAPGLTAFASFSGADDWHGGLVVGNLLYGACESKIKSFDSGGVEADLGTYSGGDAGVFWAHNNKSPPDVVFVEPGEGAFQVTTAPAVIAYPDADVGVPNSVCFLDGYFFFTNGAGLVLASAINDTAIDPLNFINVYGNDELLRAVPFGELYLFGNKTIEPWQNTANEEGFPFTRVKVIPRGLLGRYALTGWEPGFGKGLFFVSDDHRVQLLSGYTPTPISTPDVERAISNFIDNGGDIETITLDPYVANGRACIHLRLGSVASWVFDIDALRWHERQSYPSLAWRVRFTVNAFDKWIGGDRIADGRLIQITEQVQNEPGQDIAFDIYSGPATAFPNRLRVAQATFDIARGVGIATGADPAQTNPRAYISWSDDGGMNWSTPVERTLGRQQTSPHPVRVNRAGQTKDQGRRWRLTVYDPVNVELTGGKMSAEVRNY
jgi:hypothetical protein